MWWWCWTRWSRAGTYMFVRVWTLSFLWDWWMEWINFSDRQWSYHEDFSQLMACDGLPANQRSAHVRLWQPRGGQQVTPDCWAVCSNATIGIASTPNIDESWREEIVIWFCFRSGGGSSPSMNMEMREAGGLVTNSVSSLRRRRKCLWVSSVLAGLVALVIIVVTIKTRLWSQNDWSLQAYCQSSSDITFRRWQKHWSGRTDKQVNSLLLMEMTTEGR